MKLYMLEIKKISMKVWLANAEPEIEASLMKN
jgi:hypothetical protein